MENQPYKIITRERERRKLVVEKPQKIPSLISLMCSGKHVERGERGKREMKSCVQHNSKALILEQRFFFVFIRFVSHY